MRIEEVAAKFLVQLEADGRSPHTIGQYRHHLGVLARWLAHERPDAQLEGLGPEDIAAFMNSPLARQTATGAAKKPNSTNAIRTSVRVFFTHAHAAGWITENPARLLRRAIVSPGPPRSMSDDEADRLLAALKRGRSAAARRDQELFGFMLGTGVRLSSALALRVEDVDLEHREVTLHNAKGGRTDVLPLSTDVGEALVQYLGARRAGFVFPAHGGKRLSRRHAHRRFAKWLHAAGVMRPYSPHSLRHSFGMRFYERTRDILLTQAALTHRSLLSTMVYARASTTDLRRALA